MQVSPHCQASFWRTGGPTPVLRVWNELLCCWVAQLCVCLDFTEFRRRCLLGLGWTRRGSVGRGGRWVKVGRNRVASESRIPRLQFENKQKRCLIISSFFKDLSRRIYCPLGKSENDHQVAVFSHKCSKAARTKNRWVLKNDLFVNLMLR